MSAQVFEEFKIDSQKTYAAELAKVENISTDEALKYASEQFYKLVPDGIRTQGQLFFDVYSEDSALIVGYLWLGFQNRLSRIIASINDIKIYENHRGRGLGKQLMALVEREAQKAGAVRVRLHVFSHNEVAKQLYISMGFAPTSIDMKKELHIPV
jgi:ribosomal protein S18 acetylase RimI-like enzyme